MLDLNLFEAANRRNLLDLKSQERLARVLRGKAGEDELAEWLKTFAPDLVYYRNLYLKHYNGCELDYFLPARTLWVHVEVKNYNYDFYVKNGVAYGPKGRLADNPLDRAKRTKHILEEIAKALGYQVRVITLVIFINQHGQVHVEGDYDLEIVPRNALRGRLIDLAQEMRPHLYSARELALLEQDLNNFRYTPSLERVDLDLSKLQLGINCASCNSFDVNVGYRHCSCNQCGEIGYKSQAIDRMVEDYCLIYDTDVFCADDIYEFIGRLIDLKSLYTMLNRRYLPATGYKRKYYLNKKK